jgi:hypothetical protein
LCKLRAHLQAVQAFQTVAFQEDGLQACVFFKVLDAGEALVVQV